VNVVRKPYDTQYRFDSSPIAQVQLNLECRDELIPLLAGLQYIYTDNELRRQVVKLVANDVNNDSRRDVGRPGMDDWQVVVLAAVRLGCNYDYDKLQDQVENHCSLRRIMGFCDWDFNDGFSFRRIRDTLCLLTTDTISKLNEVIVVAGQKLHGDAAGRVRADSFVVESNVHYPTESSLIWDGVRKSMGLCTELANVLGVDGWRQAKHLGRKIKNLNQSISRISSSKSPKKKAALKSQYGEILQRTKLLLERAKTLVSTAESEPSGSSAFLLGVELSRWISLTEQVCNTAERRVILGEQVPNCDKLFSLFETHTQLYRRGKAKTPNQFGRLVLVFEDNAGFISHYHLMGRDASDSEVVVEQTKIAQRKHKGQIASASFDRGFHSLENEKELGKLVAEACVLPRSPGQYAEKIKNESVSFRKARRRHSGVESAIGALQSGNGLKRCRDRSEVGFDRYFGLAILGRNIHTLGKLLIRSKHEKAAAGQSKREAA